MIKFKELYQLTNNFIKIEKKINNTYKYPKILVKSLYLGNKRVIKKPLLFRLVSELYFELDGIFFYKACNMDDKLVEMEQLNKGCYISITLFYIKFFKSKYVVLENPVYEHLSFSNFFYKKDAFVNFNFFIQFLCNNAHKTFKYQKFFLLKGCVCFFYFGHFVVLKHSALNRIVFIDYVDLPNRSYSWKITPTTYLYSYIKKKLN